MQCIVFTIMQVHMSMISLVEAKYQELLCYRQYDFSFFIFYSRLKAKIYSVYSEELRFGSAMREINRTQ